jgi:RNA polymerase sigma-70 factor (ECF subfamily)
VAGRIERERVRDPDPRTLERARRGDLGAVEELVRAYQADAYRFAWYLTRDHALSEDVTQESFLRMFRFLHAFRGGTRFSSWLFSIVRNCAMDALRREGRSRTTDPEAIVVDRPVADASARAEIEAALRTVTPEHREAFLLVEVFGLTYQEAADVLDVRVGTIKSRMFRARQALCAALADDVEAGSA